MKKFILIFYTGFFGITAYPQNALQEEIELNVLNAPSNTAFNLMGISPSAIDRPTDLNNFKLSIQNASNSFTKFPSDYAVEFSPASLFNASNQTLKLFNSTRFKDVFWQSFGISIGFTKSNIEDKDSGDSTAFTKTGFGIKFSIIRPRWKSSIVAKVDTFYDLQAKALTAYNTLSSKFIEGDPSLLALDRDLVTTAQLPAQTPGRTERILSLINLKKLVRDSLSKVLVDSLFPKSAFLKAANILKEYTKGLKIEREGGFLDFASGLALDFPDSRFNYSLVSKAGVWLTGGYENGNKGLSIALIARYLFQPDKIFADENNILKSDDISTFDAGGKLSLSAFKGKFTMGTEFIYRSVLNNVIPSSNRLVFNTEYDVGFNQKLTLALGKNFDGTITKGGNLIAALNYIKGFGATKKVHDK